MARWQSREQRLPAGVLRRPLRGLFPLLLAAVNPGWEGIPSSACHAGGLPLIATGKDRPPGSPWSGHMPRADLPRQRLLTLWFPQLPLDRILRLQAVSLLPSRGGGQAEPTRAAARTAARPQAVIHDSGQALRLRSLDATAVACGLRPGDALTDARARVPDLQVHREAPELEAALLASLADWCDRYTPLVALEAPDRLVLDITGCAHLHGGEAGLMADALARLQRQGFAVRAAIADTAAATRGLACHATSVQQPGVLVPEGEVRKALAPLPLAALGIAPEAVAALSAVGLTRIADILGQPRAPLAARYGLELLRRLDQALGEAGESISPRLAPPLILAERRLFEPVARLEDIEAILLSLGGQVSDALERRVEGGRLFEFTLFRVDGHVQRLMVGTSRPLRGGAALLSLFRQKLKADEGALEAGFGFDLLRLAVLEAQSFAPHQTSLEGGCLGGGSFGGAGEDATTDLAGLVDRLGARLGLARVARFMPVDHHLPEARVHLVPAASVADAALAWDCEPRPGGEAPLTRPLRLLVPAEPVDAVAIVPEGPPLRFRWRRALYRVARSEGPERLAPPWWLGAGGAGRLPETPGEPVHMPTRDYYRIEDEEGRRFWIYRDGLYERETADPRWFLQGVFA